jgi:hypothetical protein
MHESEFFLRFIEGFHEEEPRRCWSVKQVDTGAYTDCLLIRVAPPLSGGRYGMGALDVQFLILSPKYRGSSLFPIEDRPTDVYVFLPTIPDPQAHDTFEPHQAKKIAFGETYRDDNQRNQPSGPRETNPR